MMVFSLACTPIFANETASNSGFDKYLNLKGENNKLDIQSERNIGWKSNSNLDSDEYIQMLLNEGIKFEVKDTYYKKADFKMISMASSEDLVELNGKKYVKVDEKVTINKFPVSLAASQGDTRIREVTESSTQVIDSLADDFDQFITGSIFVLASYAHPVGGFVSSLATLFPYNQEEYGWVRAEVLNAYYYTNVWHEVYDIVGYIPMVITESRRTNVKYEQNVTNKYTGASDTEYKWYQAVYYEYSMYYGELTRNLNEAENRYNAGLRNPQIYRYYTGTVIDNTSKLP
jgi:hypothetical protein